MFAHAMTVPAFTERGTGRTAVVMLHGVGGGKEAFAAQLQPIADAGYRAVAWDMPGYGDSPAITPYDMAGLARALVALLDALHADRAVLLGHSMGAMVALEAVARTPARVAGLVLSAGSPAFGKPDGAWQQVFLGDRLGPLDQGKTMADVAQRLVPSMIGEGWSPEGVALATATMSRVSPATYRAALHALMGFDRRESLAGIRVPTLAIAGACDSAAPPAVMEKMAARIPGARYVVLAGAGHLANMEQPQVFNAAVLAFLHQHFKA
jgi:pimeloyl-ACP methyl ester carboxylesterase